MGADITFVGSLPVCWSQASLLSRLQDTNRNNCDFVPNERDNPNSCLAPNKGTPNGSIRQHERGCQSMACSRIT